MKNKIIRTFTVTLAAVLCLTAFSTTAFAGGTDPNPEPLPETTEAPQEEEPTTGGMEPEGVPVTPEGNATLVDDFYGDKQLITVTTKAGNYFYILIDRANEDKETAVHFLNQVDDADLQALLEDGEAAPDQEAVPSRQFDISKIDFDLLSREFARTRRKNLLLRDLDELVNQQLAKMLFANPQRIDYYDRYQEIIDAYNAEQNRATIEKTFMDLMELASSLDMEQQRYVREGFSSDEELSVYDLLFSENLTKQEIETIKKVSVDLLTKIKQQIAKLDHWTDKQETKAIVDNLIRNTLWQELPNSYDVSDIQTYQKKIYEYVYMRYPEVA